MFRSFRRNDGPVLEVTEDEFKAAWLELGGTIEEAEMQISASKILTSIMHVGDKKYRIITKA